MTNFTSYTYGATTITIDNTTRQVQMYCRDGSTRPTSRRGAADALRYVRMRQKLTIKIEHHD